MTRLKRWVLRGRESLAMCVGVWVAMALAADAAPTLSFVSASDTHYMSPDEGNDLERIVLNSINSVMNRTMASSAIRSFRGVTCPGDLIDKGSAIQWDYWRRDFGLTGGDGAVLQHPVYEDFGGTGHDGVVSRDGITARNPLRFGVAWSTSNGYNYSWDWNGIHFVIAGIVAGASTNDPDRVFLANDLTTHVGTSGRPVVVIEHENAALLVQDLYTTLLTNYNVILILDGHQSGGAVMWNGIQTLSGNGFLAGYWVVRINGTTVQASRTTGGSGNLSASVTRTITVPACVASMSGATDGSWDQPAAWSGGVTPQNIGDFASLDGSDAATITLDGVRTVSGLNLDTTGSAGYTITAGSAGSFVLQKVAGPVSVSATGNHAIDASIALASDAAVWVDANSTLTVSGDISGTSRGLAKAGLGTLVLSTANNYSGTTVADAGILRLSHSEALPGGIGAAGGTSALTFNGGRVELTDIDFLRSLGTGSHQVQFIGPGGFNCLGSSGDRAVNLGGTAATVTWASGSFVPTGFALRLSSTTGSLHFQNPIALGSSTRVVEVAAGIARLDGGVSGTGGLTKSGAGMLVLPKAATYSGITTVLSGSLQLGADDVTGSVNDFTLSGVITGAGSLVKAGSTTVTLGNANTYTGGTTIASGTLRMGHAGSVGFGAPVAMGSSLRAITVAGSLDLNGKSTGGKITLVGGTLLNNSATAATIESIAGAIPVNGGTGIPAGSTISISGGGGSGATVRPSFGLTVNSFTFTAAGIDYSVGDILYITGGGGSGAKIRVTSSGPITSWTLIDPGSGYTNAPTTVFGGGGNQGNGGRNAAITGNYQNFQVVLLSLTNAGSGYTSAPTISLSGGTGFAATGILSSVVLTAPSSLGGSGDLIIAAPISGAYGITKNGDGKLTLARASSYIGETVVNDGILKLENGDAISASIRLGIAAGATVDVSTIADGLVLRSGQTINGNGAILGDVTMNSGSTNAPGTSPGTITMNGNLTMEAGSVFDVELVATDSYDRIEFAAGTATVNNASLRVNLGAGSKLGTAFTIISGTMVPGEFADLPEGTQFTPASGDTSKDMVIHYVPDGVTLTVVPEPAVLGVLGILGLLAARRRDR